MNALEWFENYVKEGMALAAFDEEDIKNLAEIHKQLKAFRIINDCLVSEFRFYEENGNYYIQFYYDGIHRLTFNLENKEEYDLLKEVLV